jgi:hypothetical protein
LQANKVVVYILVNSFVCLFVPNVFAGLGEMLGLAVYKNAGPIVTAGLVACGMANAFVYGIKHKNIRSVIMQKICKREVYELILHTKKSKRIVEGMRDMIA